MEGMYHIRLSEAIELISGGTPKTSESSYWGGDIPWLSVKDFGSVPKYVYNAEKHITQKGFENCASHMLHKDDIIISARGTVGALAMIGTNMAFNQSCYGIRGKEGIDNHYLFYLLKTKIAELNANSHGSVFSTITRNTFDSIYCNIPSLRAQIRIASILSSLDDKVDCNNRLIANLEAQAKTIFKSWFVDFEPFKKEKFVDSELDYGIIPKDFTICKIDELPLYITDYVSNGSFASLKQNVTLHNKEEYAIFIRNTDLKSHQFGVFVDKHSYDFLSKSRLYGDEIIISNVGDVGSVFLCPRFNKPMTLGNNVIMIRPEQQNLKYYLYIFFKWSWGQHLIDGITGGSVQRKFNKTDFRNSKIIVPNKEVLNNFESLVSPIFDKIAEMRKESARIEEARDTLLPRLMTGELKVD